MKFFGHEEALGMPAGSVRAILAILLVGATIGSAFVLPEIAIGLLTLTTVVVKDYFGKPNNGQQPTP